MFSTRKEKPGIIPVGNAVGFLKVRKEFKGCFEIERLPWLALSDTALRRKVSVDVAIHFYSYAVNSTTNGLCRKFVYCLEIPLKENIYTVLIKYYFGCVNNRVP